MPVRKARLLTWQGRPVRGQLMQPLLSSQVSARAHRKVLHLPWTYTGSIKFLLCKAFYENSLQKTAQESFEMPIQKNPNSKAESCALFFKVNSHILECPEKIAGGIRQFHLFMRQDSFSILFFLKTHNPRACVTNRPSSKMLQRDLASAGKNRVRRGQEKKNRKRREKSDFLRYENSKGLGGIEK